MSNVTQNQIDDPQTFKWLHPSAATSHHNYKAHYSLTPSTFNTLCSAESTGREDDF